MPFARNGFPDWRDAAAYPDESTFSEPHLLVRDPLNNRRGWAWEFLRRSADYQQDFKLYQITSPQEKARISAKYSLLYMVPHSLFAPECPAPFLKTFALRELQEFSPISAQIAADKIALVFDLTLPIEPQLDMARAQIEDKASTVGIDILWDSRTRLRNKAWPRYLRVLDARRQGVKSSEIVTQFILDGVLQSDTLADHEKQINTDYKRATEYSRHGYMGIMYKK